jgi:hypothetical protein
MKTDLHFSEIGQGEPIVFIHGGFDPAEETFGEQKELADQYRVRCGLPSAVGQSCRSSSCQERLTRWLVVVTVRALDARRVSAGMRSRAGKR